MSPADEICLALDPVTDEKPTVQMPVAITAAEPTYRVSTWDHEIEGWQTREACATKWAIRRWLKRLYAEGWDHPSILVERNP